MRQGCAEQAFRVFLGECVRLGKQGARAAGSFEEIGRSADRGKPAASGNPHPFNACRRGGPHVGVAVAHEHDLPGLNPKSRIAFVTIPGAGLRQSQPSSGPCGQK